jgi:hypothetical protein
MAVYVWRCLQGGGAQAKGAKEFMDDPRNMLIFVDHSAALHASNAQMGQAQKRYIREVVATTERLKGLKEECTVRALRLSAYRALHG